MTWFRAMPAMRLAASVRREPVWLEAPMEGKVLPVTKDESTVEQVVLHDLETEAPFSHEHVMQFGATPATQLAAPVRRYPLVKALVWFWIIDEI
jgi:hypothetical protein